MAEFEALEVIIKAKDEATAVLEKTKTAFNDVKTSAESAAKTTQENAASWQSVAKGVFAGTAALGAAKAAFGFLKNEITASIKEAGEYQRIDAQLAAALKSTGGAVGFTKDQLTQYAEKLSGLTAIDDDAIKSAQAMLVTFTNLRGEAFNGATQAVLDMATAMNGGGVPSIEQLRATALQVGKALNNPIDGLTALTRAGVTFTEQQKKQIETMVKAGNVLGAQKIALDELSKEFGGSASAAAKTFEGRMAKLGNAFGDVRKEVGLAIVAAFTPFVEKATEVADATSKSAGRVSGLTEAFYTAMQVIKALGQVFGGIVFIVVQAGNVFFSLGRLVAGVAYDIYKNFKTLATGLKDIFSGIGKFITGDFSGAAESIKKAMDLNLVFAGTANSMQDIKSTVASINNEIAKSFSGAWNTAKEAVTNSQLPDKLRQIHEAEQEVANNAQKMQQALAEMTGSADKAGGATSKIKDALKDLAKEYVDQSEAAKEELQKLETAHAETTENIKGKINELKASLVELNDQYKKSMGDINKTEAESVVAQEQKIKDLKKSLEEAQKGQADSPSEAGAKRLAEAQAALAAEQAAYQSYIDQRKGLDSELAEARRRAALTDFQRTIEDINARRTEAETEHAKKMEQINAEIAEQEATMAREKIVFEAKRAEYLATQEAFTKFHDDYITKINGMKTVTSAAVEGMKAKLAEIKAAVSQIESARNQAGLQALAAGAVQTPAQAAAAAAAGNTPATPATVNINLGGVTVTNEADEDRLVQKIVRSYQLAALGTTQ